MTVSEVIRTKHAVRQFTDTPLSEEAIRSILNAGRRAQSSKNTQPWHFIAIRNRATMRQLAECGTYAGHLAGASSSARARILPVGGPLVVLGPERGAAAAVNIVDQAR